MRTFIQALSLSIFSVLFFFFANYKLPEWLPADIYLRLDPLLGLGAFIAGKRRSSLVPCGRLFLSGRPSSSAGFSAVTSAPWEWPLIFWTRSSGRKKGRPGLKKELAWRKVKFIFLFLFLGSSLVGLTLAYLLDPLPS